METYTPEELTSYIIEDYLKFLNQSLTPAQAITRVIVEYEEQLKKNKEKIIIYLTLFYIGNKYKYRKKEILDFLLKVVPEDKLDSMLNISGNDIGKSLSSFVV